MIEFQGLMDLDQARPRFENRRAELEIELAKPELIRNAAQMKALGRELRNIDELLELYNQRAEMVARKTDNEQILREESDAELLALAQEDNDLLIPQLEALEERIFIRLAPPSPEDSRNTIVEIRAGTGGEEAALFAGDLFRMYTRYAEMRGWKVEMMESNPTNLGGFKEVIFLLEGEDAYGNMKFESGVHRVQRVPETEAQGRIHTSAVSVAVLPEAEEVDVQINADEIRVDIFCSSGPGGQSVNTTYSAIRITHLPTGIVVSCQDEKSQIKNRAKAMTVLRARLMAKAEAEREDAIAATRRSQVRSGDRSEKIRTYNFPQNRVTDHRINLSLYKLDRVLGGELEEFIDGLRKADALERLAEAAA